MSRKKLLVALLIGVCLVAVAGILTQHVQLGELRAEEQRLRATSNDSAAALPTALEPEPSMATPPAVSPELLRLRSQVSRLRTERRELAAVRVENERLRQGIAAAKTNAPALPPGYIRKAAAQFAGQATPEDTIQTFLWAVQHRDVTNLLQTLSPESARRMEEEFQRNPPEQFFKSADALPGLGIEGRRDAGDGILEIKLLMVPDLPAVEIRFLQIGGQWKMDMPH